jgi:hypothetical protein
MRCALPATLKAAEEFIVEFRRQSVSEPAWNGNPAAQL